MEFFRFGDCKDACIGTLLHYCHINHPETLIFNDLRFTLKKTVDSYRTLELSYRVEEYLNHITKETGIEFYFGIPGTFDKYINEINSLIEHSPVIIVVDHFEYKHSQFYRSLHMPHYIILTSYEKNTGEYEYIDPFPYYNTNGRMNINELLTHTNSPYLLEHRNVYLYFDNSKQKEFDSSDYLINHHINILNTNVKEMLFDQLNGQEYKGVNAIRHLASYINDWVNDDENFMPYAGSSKKFPINSFLDMGNNRLGHSIFLKRLGVVINSPSIISLSGKFKKIASYWNTVSSLRHLYQEENISKQYEISPAFIVKKLKKVPQLIYEIANAEEEAINDLAVLLKRDDNIFH